MMPGSRNLRMDKGTPWRVLVVDDDRDILRLVRYTLEEDGFEVTTVGSGVEALESVAKDGLPHLAIVDIMMPGMDGLELCRRLHDFSDLPVVMLTAVDEEQTTVETIRDLAEDYITKPFRPRELVARVGRVLRRIDDLSYASSPQLVIDDWLTLDLGGRKALVNGAEIALTPTETKIVHILIRRVGRTITTGFLLRRIWPMDEVFEDTLRVHIHRLRQKLEPKPDQPRYLLTERGLGYQFAQPVPAHPL